MTPMRAKLFTNVKLRGNKNLTDLLVEDGRYKEISPNLASKYSNIEKIDFEGRLVLAPYVEPHIHLDYVYTSRMPGADNTSGTLFEGIQRWSETKSNFTVDDVKKRACIALKKQIVSGIQYVRTHVDVTEPGLVSLKALLELKEELKDILTLQIVAFPQEGMFSYPRGYELVEEALKLGADVVGGIPHYELTREMGERSLQKVFELAMKYDKLIDIHCDETDDIHSRFIENLSALAYLNEMGKRTTASHTCAMGSYNNAYVDRLLRSLKLSKINFISCPTENIHLQGRGDSYPKRRGLTRVKELLEAGLNVCFAQDSISDPWYPLGSGNLMNILDAGIHLSHLTSINQIYEAFDLITINGAKTLNIQDQYGIEIGNDANFIVLDASDEMDAICERVNVNYSFSKGECLLKRIPEIIETDNSFLKA